VVVVGDSAGDEVLSCTEEESRSVGEVQPCWLGVAGISHASRGRFDQRERWIARDDGRAQSMYVVVSWNRSRKSRNRGMCQCWVLGDFWVRVIRRRESQM
jgi:hypothetical protein